jgi:hypothetical protein
MRRSKARTALAESGANRYTVAMPSTRSGRASIGSTRLRREWDTLRRRVDRWWQIVRVAARAFNTVPRVLRIVAVTAALLLTLSASNLAYQVIRKPTELLFPFGNLYDKPPAETWRHYGGLFREYSTAFVAPELLAALAQVEGAGNPVAHTYWRWRLSWNPFAIFRPASSAVGMYQMTDPAFAEARRHCIRDHAVIDNGVREDGRGCWLNGFYSRIVASHAIELASIYLDRKVAALLASLPAATAQQRQDVAALVHLCGSGPAGAFARRGFRLARGEHCGDHDAAAYLAGVSAMTRQFRALAAADP